MYRLPKFLRPNSKTKLIRLGKFNDGGYSIPEKSLKEAKILFSFGLDEDWSFEEDFKKKTEAQIICFDNSVNNKFWIKRFLKDLIYFNFKSNIYENFKRFFTFFKYKRFFMQKNVYHIKKHITSNDIIFDNPADQQILQENNIQISFESIIPLLASYPEDELNSAEIVIRDPNNKILNNLKRYYFC